MIGTVQVPYGEYPAEFKFNLNKTGFPSRLFTEVLSIYKTKGKDSFRFLGRVDPPITPRRHRRLDFDPYSPPLVNKKLLPFCQAYLPEYLDGGRLLTKYMLTSKYPKAEYVSTSKYANDYNAPIGSYWQQAQLMCAQAFSVMDKSPPMSALDAFRWLERQSSPGYPWSKLFASKAPIIDADWSFPWYQAWERAIFRGKAGPFYWRSFIKDEVKKAEDVLGDNPRSILACPWQASVLGNRLFGPMNDKLARNGPIFGTPCFVGVSKYNKMWTQLAMYLKEHPRRAHGDCTRFDGTVSPYPFKFVKEFRNSCLGKDFEKLVDYYYKNVVNSNIVGWEGDVFEKCMGQPSGQTNTLTDNSIIHTLYWFYHWCSYVCKRDSRFRPTWFSFRQHVNLVIMGDDVIYSWSDEVGELMAPSAVIATFATLKVTLKCEEDSSEDLEHMEFCSMTFRRFGVDYVPVMKREKMLASLFLKQTEHPRLILRRALAIRIEVFWDDWLFHVVDRLVDWMLDNFNKELVSPLRNIDGDDTTLEQMLSTRLTQYEIMKHYLEV